MKFDNISGFKSNEISRFFIGSMIFGGFYFSSRCLTEECYLWILINTTLLKVTSQSKVLEEWSLQKILRYHNVGNQKKEKRQLNLKNGIVQAIPVKLYSCAYYIYIQLS